MVLMIEKASDELDIRIAIRVEGKLLKKFRNTLKKLKTIKEEIGEMEGKIISEIKDIKKR